MIKRCSGCEKRGVMLRDGAHALLRGDVKRTVQKTGEVFKSLGADVGRATRIAALLESAKKGPKR